ncbi:MAG: FAD-dependent oxidoreductase [Rhodospirillales bacterium]
MTYVIIGAGPAGVVAAETLAKTDPGADIVLLGGEADPPYSRMAIPYVLTGIIDHGGTHLRKTAGHYDALGITYRQGIAERIDSKARKVRLQGGGEQAYDKLLIATGAHPVKPPVPGLDLPGVHHCWTLDDCREIEKLAHEGAHVVLMGAGFIGCIILEALAERGVKLTVVEALDRMVPRMMNETAGNMIKDWCQAKGIAVHTGTKVTKIEKRDGGDEDRLFVDLDTGDQVPAHLVVVAAGVKSNIDFIEGAGIKAEQGILVDEFLRTSVDTIYAAGDCAQGPDFGGGFNVHAIQPTATEHGRIAALNMAGKPTPYQGSLQMNVLDTAGLISMSFGDWEGGAGTEYAEVLDADRFKYLRLNFKDDVLVGALSLGRTDHMGVLRGLIQNRTPLGLWKGKLMDDPNRIMEAYVAHAYA